MANPKDPAAIQAALSKLQADQQASRENMAKQISEMTSTNMAGSIASSLPGIDTSALSGLASNALNQASEMATGVVNSVSGIVNDAMNKASDMASSLMSSASSVLGSSLSDIAGAFPDAAKQMFSAINEKVGDLGSIAGDLLKGPKEVDSILKTLGADSAEAIQSPVAFISKPLNDVMQGVENMAQGSSMMDALGGLTGGALSDLSSAVGSVLSNPSDIMGAINNVTNDLASNLTSGISSFAGSVTSSITGVIGPITSTVGSYASSLMDGAKSMLGGIGSGDGILGKITGAVSSVVGTGKNILGSIGDVAGSVIGGAQSIIGGVADSLGIGGLISSTGLTNGALAKLPSTMLNNLANQSLSSVAGAASSFMQSKLGSFNNVLGALTGVTSNQDLLSRVMGLGGSYPAQTVNGQPLSSTFGNNPMSTITKMYKAASGICGNVQMPSNMNNYAMNKDMFDILAGLSIDLGMNDLLKQLMNCGGEGYIDNRTTSALKYKSTSVARKGDVNTYRVLQQSVGSQNIINPIRDSQILVANMQGTSSQKSIFREVLDDFGLKNKDLTHTNYAGRDVVRGAAVSFMSAAGTSIIDSMVGTQTRKLAQAAIYAFS